MRHCRGGTFGRVGVHFKSGGDQATIDAMLQAQARGEQNLQQNLGIATGDLSKYLSGHKDPASGGTIKGPTNKDPKTVGGAPVPGPTPYKPPPTKGGGGPPVTRQPQPLPGSGASPLASVLGGTIKGPPG